MQNINNALYQDTSQRQYVEHNMAEQKINQKLETQIKLKQR
jgi:hypothetical protein